MKYFFLLSLFLLNLQANAQEQVRRFEKKWGPHCSSQLIYVDELANGDFIVLGNTQEYCDTFQTIDSQIYLARLDSNGNIIWQKLVGQYNSQESVFVAHKCFDQTYLVVGNTEWPDNGGGVSDALLMRFDANGSVLLKRNYGIGFEDYGCDATELSDSSLVFFGHFAINNGMNFAPTYVRTDRQGNVLVMQQHDSLVNYKVWYAEATSDGGVIAAGKSGAAASQNVFLAKFDTLGDLVWIKYPYGKGMTGTNDARGLFVHRNDTVEICVYEFSRIAWKKFDSNGNYLSEIGVFEGNAGNFCVSPRDSSILTCLSALTYDHLEVSKFNSLRKPIIVAQGSDADPTALNKIGYYAIPTRDGGYVAVGSYKEAGGVYYYFVKFDPAGNYLLDPFSESISTNPNPSVDGLVTVSFDVIDADVVTLEIYALDGKRIFSESIPCAQNSHTDQTFDFTNQGAGMYLVSLSKSDVVVRRKILVAKGR